MVGQIAWTQSVESVVHLYSVCVYGVSSCDGIYTLACFHVRVVFAEMHACLLSS